LGFVSLGFWPPQAARYATVDLGHDEDGRLVLTYERCASSANASCKFLRDDLDGRRSSFRGLAPANCELSTAPALWRGRAAYGLLCLKGRSEDTARSGLYVKQRGRAPRQLPLKQRVVPFGVTNVTAVDLRGTRVAALAAGGAAEVALTETVAGRGVRSFVAADSEGDTGQSASGARLGAGGTLWTLTDTEHLDDPLQSTIKRLTGACLDFDTLVSSAGAQPPSGFRASDLAVDGRSLYLVVPGAGIVSHTFTPSRLCGGAGNTETIVTLAG